MTSDQLPEEFRRRGAFMVGSKIYARCDGCGAIVRLNKPIFGGLHLCK